jgi:deoxyribodipyrimidine photolyase-related protein
MIYLVNGKKLVDRNFFNLNNSISDEWFVKNASNLPGIIRSTINQTLQCGYMNHIQRLMIVLSYMLMSEIKPYDMIKWFMEMTIDSYEWVMYPCICGFSYSDGGLTVGRPYFSSTRYLRRMTNFNDFGDWDKVYDRFLTSRKKKLSKIYIVNTLVKNRSKRK